MDYSLISALARLHIANYYGRDAALQYGQYAGNGQYHLITVWSEYKYVTLHESLVSVADANGMTCHQRAVECKEKLSLCFSLAQVVVNSYLADGSMNHVR
jgi:hypothetical protein